MQNQSWLAAVREVPTPVFRLEHQRAAAPGAPGACLAESTFVPILTGERWLAHSAQGR
jgi:hypothetical protein